MADYGDGRVDVLVAAGGEPPTAAARLDEQPRLTTDIVTTQEAVLSSLSEADCIVSTQRLETGSGLDLLRDVRERAPEQPFVLFPSEAEASEALASAAISAGISEYCRQEETDASSLADCVTRAVEQSRQGDHYQAEFEEMLDRVSDAFLALDDTSRFAYLDDRAEELLDVTAGEVCGEHVEDIFPAAAGSEVHEECRHAMETGESTAFEAHYPPLDRWFEAEAYPTETGLSVYFRDVTDRKDREHELELYERIVETVGDGVYALDADGRFVFVNSKFAAMYGREAEALLGEQAETVHGPAVADRAGRLAEELHCGDDDWVAIRHQFGTADGDSFPVETRFGVLEYDNGEFGRVGVVRDISARVEREEELATTTTAFRGLHDAVSDRDTDFETTLNRLFGLGSEYLGLEYGFLTRVEADRQTVEHSRGDHPKLQPGEEYPLERTYCQETVGSGSRTTVPDADAAGWTDDPAYEVFELDAYIGGTVAVAGDIYGTLCFASDDAREPFAETETALVDLLAQWVSFELERRALRDERERLAFFNRLVRHDLLNDLNVVSARSRLLYDHLDQGAEDHLDLVVERTEKMIDLTETIRSLMTTVVSGRNLEPVNLGVVLQEEAHAIEHAHDSTTVHLNVPVPDVEVRADGLLGELFENLLQNAVDHDDSPETTVEIDVEVAEQTVTVHIADDGPGMSDHRKDQFFERGVTSEESTGTGVGLYLVDELLDVYGGDVEVRDNDPQGTVFSVTLRRAH